MYFMLRTKARSNLVLGSTPVFLDWCQIGLLISRASSAMWRPQAVCQDLSAVGIAIAQGTALWMGQDREKSSGRDRFFRG